MQKKPTCSAASTSSRVISSIRESKLAREIVGISRSRYFVCPILGDWAPFLVFEVIRLACPDPVNHELRAVLPALGEILKATNLEFYITRLSYLAFSGYTEERAAMLFRCVALLLLLVLSYQGHRRRVWKSE
jgi:hypothetical protein